MSESGFETYVNSMEGLFRSHYVSVNETLEESANVRLIQELIAAIGRDDLATVWERLAEDVRLVIRGADELPFIREATGREPMLEAIKHNFGALQDQQPRIKAVFAQGDTVTVVLEEEGTLRESGQRYRIKGTQKFFIRAGKVELVEEDIASV